MYSIDYTTNNCYINNNYKRTHNNSHDFSNESIHSYNKYYHIDPEVLPSLKRRKFSATVWESYNNNNNQCFTYEYPPSRSKITLPLLNGIAKACGTSTLTSYKCDIIRYENEDAKFMSRDEIERFFPSRKDGIDALHEIHLRYSYCVFLQNLRLRLEM